MDQFSSVKIRRNSLKRFNCINSSNHNLETPPRNFIHAHIYNKKRVTEEKQRLMDGWDIEKMDIIKNFIQQIIIQRHTKSFRRRRRRNRFSLIHIWVYC